MIDTTVTPTAETRRLLRQLQFGTPQRAKAARLIGAEMVYRTEERFANQKSPDGSPW